MSMHAVPLIGPLSIRQRLCANSVVLYKGTPCVLFYIVQQLSRLDRELSFNDEPVRVRKCDAATCIYIFIFIYFLAYRMHMAALHCVYAVSIVPRLYYTDPTYFIGRCRASYSDCVAHLGLFLSVWPTMHRLVRRLSIYSPSLETRLTMPPGPSITISDHCVTQTRFPRNTLYEIFLSMPLPLPIIKACFEEEGKYM